MNDEIKNIIGNSKELSFQQTKDLSYYIQNLFKLFRQKNINDRKFINCLKKFQPENEKEEKILELGMEAREQLFIFNEKLVGHFAKRHKNRSLPIEDMISYGYLGLMEAVEKYDGSNKFSTYAYWWINSEIKKNCAKNDKMLSCSLEQPRRIYRINKLIQEHKSQGKEISIKEISLKLKISQKTIKTTLNNDYTEINIDESKNVDNEKYKKVDGLKGDDNPFENLIKEENKEENIDLLKYYISKLNKHDKNILVDYYICNHSIEDLCSKYNISKYSFKKRINSILKYLRRFN